MFVYLHGERQQYGDYRLHVSPAADKEGLEGSEPPADWVENDSEKTPKNFAVTFTDGRAEVDENMGRYLVNRGIAQRRPASGLITRARGLLHV